MHLSVWTKESHETWWPVSVPRLDPGISRIQRWITIHSDATFTRQKRKIQTRYRKHITGMEPFVTVCHNMPEKYNDNALFPSLMLNVSIDFEIDQDSTCTSTKRQWATFLRTFQFEITAVNCHRKKDCSRFMIRFRWRV